MSDDVALEYTRKAGDDLPPIGHNGGPTDAEIEAYIVDMCAHYVDDPLGWALWAFPWGEEGSPLKGRTLRTWQREFLAEWGELIRARGFDGAEAVLPILMARASGHGIGKSALVAIIILFIMSTRPGAKGVVTANTESQLRTKTWAELNKWWRMCMTQDWFRWHGGKNSLSFVSASEPATWRVDGQTCREENSEAFAGLHSADSTPFYIFDEASAVPDAIYDVANGGLTDGEPMWFCFGNPTRNSGRFRELFGKLKHRWNTKQIDSRKVEGTNKALFEEWTNDWGEDSDFFRVRVRGMFPKASSLQFIGNDIVAKAMRKDHDPYYTNQDALICGIDVARGGDDYAVIYFRRGMDARTIPYTKIPGEQIRNSTIFLAKIVDLLDKHKPDAIFVDATGIGGPIADDLRRLNYPAYDVGFGDASPHDKCANMGTYMWAKMRKAIGAGLALPVDDSELEEQLTQRDYTHNDKDKLILEKKKEMKKRGLASPDIADGLCLTWAMDVSKANNIGQKHNPGGQKAPGVMNRAAVPNHVTESDDA